jgi:hypothetical protein
MALMRKPVRALSKPQTGIKSAKLYRTSRLIRLVMLKIFAKLAFMRLDFLSVRFTSVAYDRR